MARPRKDEAVKKWLEQIERAKGVKKLWEDTFRVSLGYDYYEGRQRPSYVPESEWITINLIWSSLEASLPSLYSVDPYFYVRLKSAFASTPEEIAGMEVKARIRAAMLNYLKAELELKPKARTCIKDAFFQFGVAKVHYVADLSENEDAGEPVLNEDGTPVLDEAGMPVLQPEVVPANEAYAISRIHPFDFLVDADAGPLNESVRWKAQRIRIPLDEAKRDLRFSASSRSKMKATEVSDESEKARKERKQGDIFQTKRLPDTVVAWEVYDLVEEKWFMLAEGNDEFLIAPDDIPESIDGDPFVDLRFTPRDDSWYPIPPVSQWIDSQREYCEVRSKLLTHRKRFNRKYEMYAPGFEDAEAEASKLVNGDDGTVILKNQPLPCVTAINDAPLDQQVHTELAYLRGDFGELAVGANQRGNAQGIDSAMEAGILEKRAMIREGDRESLVQDFIIGVGRKLDQCVQAHITRDQAVRVAGPEGEAWMMVRPQDYDAIEGEYDYSISVGATTPYLPEVERSQFMAFLTLMANAPQLLTSKRLLDKSLEMFRLDDKALADELYQMGQSMMSGAMGQPGTQGSAPGGGVPGSPASATMGAMMGANNIRGGQ